MNPESLNRIRALSAMVAAATLAAACGGGSDDAAAPPPVASPPPAPATVAISGKAVDGALRGAIACYDTSNNGACESNEPTSAASGADGSFIIPGVATAAAGQHRVVVVVPADAVDADTGNPVGKAFVLIAPATGTAGAQSVFVSPLTTLVQRQMDAGQSKAEAVAFVQSNLALAVSPLADFTASANADNLKAAHAARLVVATQTKQATDLTAAVGQADVSGSTVTQPQVDVEVAKTLGASLAAIGSAAADPTLAGKTGAPLVAAVGVLASAVVAQVGLTVPEVVAQVGVAKLPPEPVSTAAPTAGASLSALRYTSASDWTMRSGQATAADNTAVNGLVRSYDVRTHTEAYNFAAGSPVVVSWGFNNDVARAGEQWWNGSAWVGCPLGYRNPATPRDASGRSNYNYCNGFEKGTSVRAAVDIAGQTLASVVTTKIRVMPGGAGGVNYADWGPADLSLLGSATFPAGSTLHYQTNTPLESAIAYDVRDSALVTVYTQAIADGGNGTTGNPAPACFEANPVPVAATSLEQIVARAPGKPCVSNPQTNADGTSLSPNEGWFATALSLGSVANYFTTLPAGTGNFYTNEGRLRVSFSGTGNGTVYYACYTRRTPASTRNCQTLGTGTYTITTLGDARVMTLNNVPVGAQRANFARVFVERGGKVYFGYKNPVGRPAPQVRLNMTAANAMLTQLSLPTLAPTDAPSGLTGAKAATMATAKGVWGGADATSALVVRFGDNGEYLLAEVDPPSGNGRPGFEYGWFDLDPATQANSRLIAVDTSGQWGLSHTTGANEGIASISDTALVTKGGETFARLTDTGTGIVGMWALGSATDLKVTHFVFFANGKVLSIHPAEDAGACLAARQGPPGVEWSDYSFNAATGALTIFNKVYDTSGCTGVFDATTVPQPASVAFTLTMAADQKTFTVPVDGGATIMTGYRIPTNP